MKMNEIAIKDESTIEDNTTGNIVLSMKPLLNFLENRIRTSSNKTILKRYEETIKAYFKGENFDISHSEISDFLPLYNTLYHLLTNPLEDERTYCWGISLPMSSKLVFQTEALSKMTASTTKKHLVNIEHFKSESLLSESDVTKIIIYASLIKKKYGIDIFNTSALVFQTKENNLDKYYRVNINNQFVDITYDGILPEINTSLTEEEKYSKESILDWLEKTIPLEKVRMVGFSYVELTDVTKKMAKEILRTLLLTSNLGCESQNKISEALQNLAKCNCLDILLLPILHINNKIVAEAWQVVAPKIEEILQKYEIGSHDFGTYLNQYIENPRLVFRENINEMDRDNNPSAFFETSPIIEGLIIKPVFSKNKLIGIVILASRFKNVVSKQVLIYVEESLALIENLFATANGNYLNQLDNVIKSKFTSIRPSVEWKFNEVALQYLKDKMVDRHPSISPIRFDDIYPIYGAIDFRNSTIERNQAEIEDRITQLNCLIETIEKIKKVIFIDLLTEWEFQSRQWISILKEGIDANQEFSLTRFLEKESITTLLQLEQMNPEVHQMIQPYIEGISPKGHFHKNSLALEKTFKILNTNIASVLDQMNDKLQEAYPCYYERYRTDGIEFTVYLGQSITPNKPFNKLYLKNAQLWQLNTMALIAKITGQSQDSLPRKILTTQLIFVHSNTITLSFRIDEHRFDVEGSYNIRYEIIKKRIDKALVKGTSERLTQPDKIAIVYFQKKDIEDYMDHIKYLQRMNILQPEIEFLELDDMQGVSGLKALRISIANYEKKSELDHEHSIEEITFQKSLDTKQ